MSLSTEPVRSHGLHGLRLVLVVAMLAVFLLVLLVPAALWLLVPKESLPYMGLLPTAAPGTEPTEYDSISIIVLSGHNDNSTLRLVQEQIGSDGRLADRVQTAAWTDVSRFDLLSMMQFSPGTQLTEGSQYLLVADREGWVRGVYPGESTALTDLRSDLQALIKEENNPFAGRSAYQMAGLLLACHPVIPAGPESNVPPTGIGR